MKVLLISENMCRQSIAPYPLGVAYVAASARRAGHDVMCLDLMFSEDPVADVATAIRDFQPGVIGVAVRNIDNQDNVDTVFYVAEVLDILHAIKEETDAPIIAGGAGFTIFPLECLEYLGLEMGIVGEGEESFARLLDAVESGADPGGIDGVALLRGGKGILKPGVPHDGFERSGSLDYEDFDVERYRWRPGEVPMFAANLQSRRGCLMRCIYCPNPVIEGRMMRTRDPLQVADELQTLEEKGMVGVFFVDSLFNYPPEYTAALCGEISRRGLAIKWQCSFSPAYVHADLFTLMRKAGCFALSIGNESGSDDILAALRKGFGKQEILDSVSAAKDAGLWVNCFLLLGGPGETRATVEESVEFVAELDADQVSVTAGIRIYPGCEIQEIAAREGVISPGRNLLEPTFYISPEVEPWLHDYASEVCGELDNWVL